MNQRQKPRPTRRSAFSRLGASSLLATLAAGAVMAAGSSSSSSAGASINNTQTPAAQSASQMAPYRGLRASEVIGMSVRNSRGENVGQIADMVVNMNTGKVHYTLLRFDPGIFQGEVLFAVPTTELRMAPDRNDIVYDMRRDQLEKAAIKRSDWNRNWRDRDVFDNLDNVWRASPRTQTAQAYRVSDLIGKDVKSRSGQEIGEIEELVIDMANQRVHYAVLEFDPGWTRPEHNYAFPLRAFQLTRNYEDLTLDVDKSLVQSMKSFNDDRFSRLNDPGWVADVDRTLVVVTPVVVTSTGNNDTRGTSGASATDSATDSANSTINSTNRTNSANSANSANTANSTDGNNRIDSGSNGARAAASGGSRAATSGPGAGYAAPGESGTDAAARTGTLAGASSRADFAGDMRAARADRN